jgi:nitrate reductase gamma subunit
MKILYPLATVALLALVGYLGGGVGQQSLLFGVLLPYVAAALFLGGFTYRVVRWAQSPVPFHIPSVSGQQRSLPWIKADPLESPHNTWGVVGRLALEVLLFRSLFRNSTAEVRDRRVIFWGEQLLWLGALAFHWSLLAIVVRHGRFFTEPVPSPIAALLALDGFFQVSVPTLYISTGVVLMAGAYLFWRRVGMPRVRYLSLPSDYFALALILGIALTGTLLRHFYRVDVVAVKELAMGLATFRPTLPEGVGPLFYSHLFLVTVLMAYFPFSKLMHLGGILLSPTRNLANNSRARRHTNPWDHPVAVHTYAEWQEEFKDKLVAAGLPLDEEARGSGARETAAAGGKHG